VRATISGYIDFDSFVPTKSAEHRFVNRSCTEPEIRFCVTGQLVIAFPETANRGVYVDEASGHLYRLQLRRPTIKHLLRSVPYRTHDPAHRTRAVTGEPRTTPVGLFEHNGHRYLFSTFGEVNWVRNLRGAGEAVLTRRRRRATICAIELPPKAAGPIMQGFLAPYLRSRTFGRVLRPRFPVAPDASVNDFIDEARAIPSSRYGRSAYVEI